jgi:hypothetical protein
MAHHCVHPWQVLATQSPCAGLLGPALRGTSALLAGAVDGTDAHPEASQAVDAPDATMKSRLVNLILDSSIGVSDASNRPRLCA